MEDNARVRYFLGANTSEGFFSLYNELEKEASFIWYKKGGPGNGKSTFMKNVASAAEAAGHSVEYILCSGDPDSLDGIVIPDLGTAYTDATSPHIQEPAVPGAGGRYIDLSVFYKNCADLDTSAAAQCFAGYRAQYAAAYDLFRGAALVSPAVIPGLRTDEDIENAFKKGLSFADRLIPAGEGWSERRRFLSAYTWKGRLSFPYADGKTYWIDDSLGLADPWLRGAAEACRGKEQKTVVCSDPLTPEKTEGLLIPKAGISFMRVARGMKRAENSAGTIRPADGVSPRSVYDLQTEIKKLMLLRGRLIELGTDRLAKAKSIHDELEAMYRPYVDFKALDDFTDEHIRSLAL